MTYGMKGFALVAVAAALMAGCGSTTGADVEVWNADVLQMDHIDVTGSVGTGASHTATAPSTPRALGSPEDLRIVLPDSAAGETLSVHVKGWKGGSIVDEQDGTGLIVAGYTKRIVICFGTAGCPAGAMGH